MPSHWPGAAKAWKVKAEFGNSGKFSKHLLQRWPVTLAETRKAEDAVGLTNGLLRNYFDED
jgi:hypothetical protein